MAKIIAHPTIDVMLRFVVNESEARALDAMAGYGDDAFIRVFYEKLGKAYMEKHEVGLRLFLKSIRDIMPGLLSKVDAAHKVFDK